MALMLKDTEKSTKTLHFIILFVIMTICVCSPAYAFKLNVKRISLYTGESYQLAAKGTKKRVKWTSTKNKVCIVTQDGSIRAVNTGKAVVKAKSGSQTVCCDVTVSPVTLDHKAEMTAGQISTIQFKCNYPEKARWQSANPSVATVMNANGKTIYILGKSAGKTTITATYFGKKYTCCITVYKPMLQRNTLYGKTIAVYGSSNETGIHTKKKKSWVHYLAEELSGIATVVNKSYGGNTVIDSVERIAEDKDLKKYDIIIISTVRNIYRERGSLPSKENPNGFLQSLYDLYHLIDPTKQTVYFASTMPYSLDFRTLSSTTSIYDALVYRTCRKLGFKYIDMHSWINLTKEDTVLYTEDGAHFYDPVHEEICRECLNVLQKGGEPLHHYKTAIYGEDVVTAVAINPEYAQASPLYSTYNKYSVDTELNVNLYLWLTAIKDIPAGAPILNPKSGVHFYPESTCLTGTSLSGTFVMAYDGGVTCTRSIPAGTTFVLQINDKSLMDAGI